MISEHDWTQAQARLRRQQQAALFAFAPDVVREQLESGPELANAALTLLTGAFVDGRSSTDGQPLDPLLEGASMILAAAGGHEQAILDLAFRVSSPVIYRNLAPLLRIVIADDAQFERAVIDALASDDDQIAARAIAIQYSAWGFPDRFTLSASGRDSIAERIARLRESNSPIVAAALAGYVEPPVR